MAYGIFPGQGRLGNLQARRILFFFNIYLFLAVQGVCCCAVFALVVASGGYSFVAVCRLLIALASLVVEHGLQELQHLGAIVAAPRSWSTGSLNVVLRVQLLHGTWHLPESGIEPASPALAGGFVTTESPGKPPSMSYVLDWLISTISLDNEVIRCTLLYYVKKLLCVPCIVLYKNFDLFKALNYKRHSLVLGFSV